MYSSTRNTLLIKLRDKPALSKSSPFYITTLRSFNIADHVVRDMTLVLADFVPEQPSKVETKLAATGDPLLLRKVVVKSGKSGRGLSPSAASGSGT